MHTSTLHFERLIDLPPAMVWEALVDETLLAGWLADATVDARTGGSYVFRWFDGAPSTEGAITGYVVHESLTINTDNRGTWAFELTQVPGGPRDRSTLVRLAVVQQPRVAPGDAGVAPAGFRDGGSWDSSLANLQSLLRGRPVDWYGKDAQHDDPGQAAPPAAARDR